MVDVVGNVIEKVDVSFGCRDERAELGSDRLLQSYVCLDCCHESGEVSLELVNQVIDGGGLC
jgi:hypothetical protein